ncbi:beta/gamma crystallin-related protein [Nostoc sp.]
MAAVVLYNDINFGGDSLASDDDIFDMSATNYNDKTSSIKVNSGRWRFCSDANLSGACFEISEGEYPQIQNDNDRISSFKRIG